jgi:hypothetical protein
MKHKQIIGSYTWNEIPSKVVIETSDESVAPHEGATPHTIHDLKEKRKNMQSSPRDPMTHQPYELDLSPWAHLDDQATLWMTWMLVADQPVPRSDPRHPLNYKGNPEDLILG